MYQENLLKNRIYDWFKQNANIEFVSLRSAGYLLGVPDQTIKELVRRKKIDYICKDGTIYVPFNMSSVLQDQEINLDIIEKHALENQDKSKLNTWE